MTDQAVDHTQPSPQGQPAEQARPKRRRNPGPRGNGRGGDGGEQRAQRTRIDRSPMTGWGDGLERCICEATSKFIPAASPVQHRSGLATMAPEIVDREPHRILLCDGQHDGPHVWPDGELVDGPPREMAMS